jgi:hypothetical protein
MFDSQNHGIFSFKKSIKANYLGLLNTSSIQLKLIPRHMPDP